MYTDGRTDRKADRQTDVGDEANCRFSQFWESVKNSCYKWQSRKLGAIWTEEIMVHVKLVSRPVLKEQRGFRSGTCVAKGVCSFCVCYFKLVGMLCFILRSVELHERLDNDHATEDV